MMRRIERENTGRMRPGQDLVAAGYAGLSGAAILAEAEHEKLARWFSEEYLADLQAAWQECRDWEVCLDAGFPALKDQPVPVWLSRMGEQAAEAEAVGSGGILKAIWDLTGAYETGVEFALRRIPILQAVIEVCERLEVNPYRLYSAGCYLLTAENGGRLAEQLRSQGVPAAVIGQIKSGIAREMIVQEGRGFLERPQPDELTRILPDAARALAGEIGTGSPAEQE